MLEVMQAHWITFLVIMFAFLVVPFYWFLVLPYNKAIKMAWATALFGAFMFLINIFDVPGIFGPPGAALIGFVWIVPSVLVWKN
jgi:ABC-type Co2+ transport system permease subunit